MFGWVHYSWSYISLLRAWYTKINGYTVFNQVNVFAYGLIIKSLNWRNKLACISKGYQMNVPTFIVRAPGTRVFPTNENFCNILSWIDSNVFVLQWPFRVTQVASKIELSTVSEEVRVPGASKKTKNTKRKKDLSRRPKTKMSKTKLRRNQCFKKFRIACPLNSFWWAVMWNRLADSITPKRDHKKNPKVLNKKTFQDMTFFTEPMSSTNTASYFKFS